MNWEVQHKGKFSGYYGTVLSALQSLPGKLLSAADQNSLALMLANQNRIMEEIRKAVSMLTASDLD